MRRRPRAGHPGPCRTTPPRSQKRSAPCRRPPAPAAAAHVAGGPTQPRPSTCRRRPHARATGRSASGRSGPRPRRPPRRRLPRRRSCGARRRQQRPQRRQHSGGHVIQRVAGIDHAKPRRLQGRALQVALPHALEEFGALGFETIGPVRRRCACARAPCRSRPAASSSKVRSGCRSGCTMRTSASMSAAGMPRPPPW